MEDYFLSKYVKKSRRIAQNKADNSLKCKQNVLTSKWYQGIHIVKSNSIRLLQHSSILCDYYNDFVFY